MTHQPSSTTAATSAPFEPSMPSFRFADQQAEEEKETNETGPLMRHRHQRQHQANGIGKGKGATGDEEEEEDDQGEEEEDEEAAEAALSAQRAAARRRLKEVASTRRFFGQLPFFSRTPPEVLDALAEVALHYTTTRDEVVLQQAAPCDDGIFFIRKGEFRVVKELPIYAPAARATRQYNLPVLTPRGEDAQAQEQQRRAANRRERAHHDPTAAAVGASGGGGGDSFSQYASNASIHSTATFMTSEAHRSAQQREREAHRASGASGGPSSHLQPPSDRSPRSGGSGSGSHGGGSAGGESLARSKHHARMGSHGGSGLDEYSELSQYAEVADSSLDSPRAALAAAQPGSGSGPTARSAHPLLIGSRFLEINVLGPYSSFGEVGVMLQVPRSASVISNDAAGQLVALTKFDWLRLNTRKTLHAVRKAALSYPSNEELLLELDDTQQWTEYKRCLGEIAADRTTTVRKLRQMPVFESVPVNPFPLRLPLLRGATGTHATTKPAAGAGGGGRQKKARPSSRTPRERIGPPPPKSLATAAHSSSLSSLGLARGATRAGTATGPVEKFQTKAVGSPRAGRRPDPAATPTRT